MGLLLMVRPHLAAQDVRSRGGFKWRGCRTGSDWRRADVLPFRNILDGLIVAVPFWTIAGLRLSEVALGKADAPSRGPKNGFTRLCRRVDDNSNTGASYTMALTIGIQRIRNVFTWTSRRARVCFSRSC